MTDTGTPASGETETPGYTSPFEEALQGLPFGLGGVFKGLTSGSGSGGGAGSFEFSVEEMRELHSQFSAEAEALKEMSEKGFKTSRELRPLANDDASRNHYQAALDHYGKLYTAINQQRTFAEGFRDAIGSAIGLKSGDEAAIGSSANKISGRMA